MNTPKPTFSDAAPRQITVSKRVFDPNATFCIFQQNNTHLLHECDSHSRGAEAASAHRSWWRTSTPLKVRKARCQVEMAGPEGLEPSTCRLEVGCSIQLSYGPRTAARRAAPRRLDDWPPAHNLSARPFMPHFRADQPLSKATQGLGNKSKRKVLRGKSDLTKTDLHFCESPSSQNESPLVTSPSMFGD